MRYKKPKAWTPDFENLPVTYDSLQGLRDKQQSGEAYISDGIYLPQFREPEPALVPVSYIQTELYTAIAEVEFPPHEEVDLLEQYRRNPAQVLTVPIESAMHRPGRNGFMPDEDKLILEARAVGIPFEDIAGLLPSRTAAAVKKQWRFLKAREASARDTSILSPGPSGRKRGTTPEPVPAEVSASASVPHANSNRPVAQVNPFVVERPGGDSKITMKGNLPQPPRGFTGMQAHGLTSLAGVSFFEEATVPDPDEEARSFTFNLREANHCACFNIGLGPDGSPLISWSDLYAIYMLPDGSKWAEHGYFLDMDDLANHANTIGRSVRELMGDRQLKPQELVKNINRFHTRLINIEYECYIYKDKVPEVWCLDGVWSPDAYFYTMAFDPENMREVAI